MPDDFNFDEAPARRSRRDYYEDQDDRPRRRRSRRPRYSASTTVVAVVAGILVLVAVLLIIQLGKKGGSGSSGDSSDDGYSTLPNDRAFDKKQHLGKKFKANAIVRWTRNHSTWSETAVETDTGVNFFLYVNNHNGDAPLDNQRIKVWIDTAKRPQIGFSPSDGTLDRWEPRRD